MILVMTYRRYGDGFFARLWTIFIFQTQNGNTNSECEYGSRVSLGNRIRCCVVVAMISVRFNKVVALWTKTVTVGNWQFPKTLHEFGFTFNAAGQLRKLDKATGLATKEPFSKIGENKKYNKERYDAMGGAITNHVYQLLINEGLHKIDVVTGPRAPNSFIFASKRDVSHSKKLLILIHGSGVVRAGQWARSLIINQSLDHGTQIPYIKRAIALGYDVLVMNTNLHWKDKWSPTLHARLVWQQILHSMKNVESFAIVAHSYGGIVTLDLAKEYADVFLSKCFAIGFTDSVHSSHGLPAKLLQHFQGIACNWVRSADQLNKPVTSHANDVPRRSAGHTDHKWTSWACIGAVFPFLEEKYKSRRSTRKVQVSSTPTSSMS